MAVAIIKRVCEKCGCEFEHRKACGKRYEADSYEKWAAEHITMCPECYEKECKESEERMIRAQAVRLGLPALDGTVKQIAWAEKIRCRAIMYDAPYADATADDIIDEMRKIMIRRKGEAAADASVEEMIEEIDGARAKWMPIGRWERRLKIRTEKSAKWIIEKCR